MVTCGLCTAPRLLVRCQNKFVNLGPGRPLPITMGDLAPSLVALKLRRALVQEGVDRFDVIIRLVTDGLHAGTHVQ